MAFFPINNLHLGQKSGLDNKMGITLGNKISGFYYGKILKSAKTGGGDPVKKQGAPLYFCNSFQFSNGKPSLDFFFARLIWIYDTIFF